MRWWYIPSSCCDERLADPLDVAQRQVALVELAVRHPLLDDPGDHRPDRRFVARGQRANRGLDPVGEHDQGRLARLRLRAGVAELALVDGRRGRGSLGRLGPPNGSAASSFARA